MKEKISVFESFEILEFECPEGVIDCEEQRAKQGFSEKREIGQPYHYNDNNFFNIFIYTNENRESICELLDHNGEIFCFATKNETQTFKLIKEMLSFIKDHSIIEKNIKFMEEEQKVRLVNEE